MTVNSHWLALPASTGNTTALQSEHYQLTEQPIYTELLITFLPDQQILPKGAASIEVTQVKDQVREK